MKKRQIVSAIIFLMLLMWCSQIGAQDSRQTVNARITFFVQ
jgi:hypothetical protein